MPQMDSKAAERTKSAESGFDMDEGIYLVQLKEVLDTDPRKKTPYEGAKGPYWNWVVTFPKTGVAAEINENRYRGRQLWRAISLDESADNMRQEAFNAFGDPTCSVNTDELIGNYAFVETYNDEYNGQVNAKVKKFMPLDAETAARLTAEGEGSGVPATSTKSSKGKSKEAEDLY